MKSERTAGYEEINLEWRVRLGDLNVPKTHQARMRKIADNYYLDSGLSKIHPAASSYKNRTMKWVELMELEVQGRKNYRMQLMNGSIRVDMGKTYGNTTIDVPVSYSCARD